MFRINLYILSLAIIVSSGYCCDFRLLDRNSKRISSLIWNQAEITDEKEANKVITENLHFLSHIDPKSCETLLKKPVIIYMEAIQGEPLEENPVSRSSFPEKVFNHPYAEELGYLNTFNHFFKSCKKIVSDENTNTFITCAIRLLSSEVAKEIFKEYHSILQARTLIHTSESLITQIDNLKNKIQSSEQTSDTAQNIVFISTR